MKASIVGRASPRPVACPETRSFDAPSRVMRALLFLALAAQPTFAAASHGRALGTTAAFDHQNRLWIVRTEPVDNNAHVVLERSEDKGATWQSPIRVTTTAEPVSADGENRPKLAFGSRDEIYGRGSTRAAGSQNRHDLDGSHRRCAGGTRVAASGVLTVSELAVP